MPLGKADSEDLLIHICLILSDYLEPTAGVDSIRYAMVILTPLAALIAAACYFKAAKTLREDLQRAPN